MAVVDARALELEHAALRELACRTRTFLKACSCGRSQDGCAPCLARELAALVEHLQIHFQSEESAWRGLDRSRLDEATLAWIDRLVAQHAELSRNLDQARADLRALNPGKPISGEFGVRIRALLDDLIDHELSEGRLFRRSVFEGWKRSG